MRPAQTARFGGFSLPHKSSICKRMLNEAERTQAEAYGWIVCDVYDLKTSRVTVQVLPAPHNEIKSAELLLRVVTMRAQTGDAFAQRVVKLVMDSMQQAETKPKRKSK